jgi:hypothetical protein
MKYLGLHEVADVLGISANTLSMRCKRGKFIEPLARLKCGPIWDAEQISTVLADDAARLAEARVKLNG